MFNFIKNTIVVVFLAIIFVPYMMISNAIADGYTPKLLVRYKMNRIIKEISTDLSIESIRYYSAGGELNIRTSEVLIALKDNSSGEFYSFHVSKLSALNVDFIQRKLDKKREEVASIKESLIYLSLNKDITIVRFNSISYINNAVYIYFDDSKWDASAIPGIEQVKERLQQDNHLTFYYIPYSSYKEDMDKLTEYYNSVKVRDNGYYLQLKEMDKELSAVQYTTVFNSKIWWDLYYTRQTQQQKIESMHVDAQLAVKKYDQFLSADNNMSSVDNDKEVLKFQRRIQYYIWKINMMLNSPIKNNKHVEIYANNGVEKIFKEQLLIQKHINIDENYLFRSAITENEGRLMCNWIDERDGAPLGVYYVMDLNTLKITEMAIPF